jgi:DNA-binding MarR family transcriptional regulator
MRELNDNVNYARKQSEDDILELIHTIMHQYRSQQYQVLRDGSYDITHMEKKVLSFFERHPASTQSDLARHSGRDKAQLARLIKGLRDMGLLDSVADENDRRNVKLTLTADGHAVQSSLQQQGKKLTTKAMRGLNNDEQSLLMSLLTRVRDNLDAPI